MPEVTIDHEGKEFTFATHEVDGIGTTMVDRGCIYEVDILDYIRLKYPRHQNILDIGANIGTHTVYFAEYLEHTAIHAFEPQPSTFALLTQNTQGYANVHLHNAACSDEIRKASMTPAEGFMSDSGLLDSVGDIDVVRVDSFGFTDVSFMKIDVEGHEDRVLKGAMETINVCHPVIILEAHAHLQLRDTFDILKPIGYNLEAVLEWTLLEYVWSEANA